MIRVAGHHMNTRIEEHMELTLLSQMNLVHSIRTLQLMIHMMVFGRKILNLKMADIGLVGRVAQTAI